MMDTQEKATAGIAWQGLTIGVSGAIKYVRIDLGIN